MSKRVNNKKQKPRRYWKHENPTTVRGTSASATRATRFSRQQAYGNVMRLLTKPFVIGDGVFKTKHTEKNTDPKNLPDIKLF